MNTPIDMRNTVSYMFLGLIFLFINFSLINTLSLMKSPIDTNGATSRVFHATLTNEESGKIWHIEEMVHSGSKIQGKIDITSSDGHFNVFYSYSNKLDDGKRLVIQDNQCDIYIYESQWTRLLPGINNQLINLILLTGPSLLDRFSDGQWNFQTIGNDEVIRGALMHSLSINLENKLNITLFYQNHLNQAIGIKQPSQIVFTGYNPDILVSKSESSVKLVLDIFLQSQTSQQLDKLVQVTPGVGCPVYLNDDIAVPYEKFTTKVHFIAREESYGKSTIIEIHADEEYQTMRYSELKYGYEKDEVYDYNLGLGYRLSETGDCMLLALDLSSRGISKSGRSLSINELLWLAGSYKYIGEITFEHRSGYLVHVWESVETNKAVEGITYDKVVTTQYMSKSTDAYAVDTLSGYIPVAASIKTYSKTATGSFVANNSIHRDYYDFNIDLPESTYQDAFQISDCYTKPEQRLTITGHLTCKGISKCNQVTENLLYELRDVLVQNLVSTYAISPLRIANIEFKVKDLIEVDFTFLEAPEMQSSLNFDYIKIQPSSVKTLHETTMENEKLCLKYHSTFASPGSAILYCESNHKCAGTNNADDIARVNNGDGASYCYIYHDPLEKLQRLGREKTLEELHGHLLGFQGTSFTLKTDQTDNGNDGYITYQLVDVIENEKINTEANAHLFEIANYEKKFANVDGSSVVVVSGVTQFGDCYRACSRSEDIPCETFSFCEGKEEKVCLVSIWMSSEISKDNLTVDANCKVYSKDHLLDYTLKEGRKFKHVVATPVELSLSECAKKCYSSNDCSSFEYCSGRCTFGGYYTESSTEIQLGCAIYMPKRMSNYRLTGSKLINDVLHTELDLDMEQCAALCDDWNACQSFNFCPKSKSSSSCQLTSHSVNDPKTATTDSTSCHNYQSENSFTSIDSISDVNRAKMTNVAGIGGGGAFGIIMAFLLIGLIIGFVGPYTFNKIKSSKFNRSSDNFEWSRQVDDYENDADTQTEI